jgi:hypothetical protein
LKTKLKYQKKKTEKKPNQANKQTHIRVSIHEGGKPLFNNNFSKGDQLIKMFPSGSVNKIPTFYPRWQP